MNPSLYVYIVDTLETVMRGHARDSENPNNFDEDLHTENNYNLLIEISFFAIMTDMEKYAKEIHKPVKQNFERKSVCATKPIDIRSIDLVDMSKIKEDNEVTFLLNIIDVYSRYAYSIPLKSKKSVEILNALKSIEATPDNI